MELDQQLTVFDVADDRAEFLRYLGYLHGQGLRPTRDSWLKEAADRLMGLKSDGLGPPKLLGQDWSPARRRLLVALTWPYTYGELAHRFPIDYATNDPEGGGVSGVYGRKYQFLWSDVRTNLKSLEWMAEHQTAWPALAAKWALGTDALLESARLGLVVTPSGQAVCVGAVDALKSDLRGRPDRAREGFVLAWWEIVAVAEGVGFSFEPIDAHGGGQEQAYGAKGRYMWDRALVVDRVDKAARLDRVRKDIQSRADAEVEASTSEELAPLQLHRQLTADGRITPPPLGSKYRPLFDHLDDINFVGKRASITLNAEELDGLTSQVARDVKRNIRGARGSPGLPNSARTNASWWYGPWNPADAALASSWATVSEPSWSEALGKKSHARAWMAAGLRAKPVIHQGTKTLVEVQFDPVTSREHWWLWRKELRAGTFSEPVWPARADMGRAARSTT